jgi:hypothetical protein
MKSTMRGSQEPTKEQSHLLEVASRAPFGDHRYSRYRWNWESINLYAPEAPGIYGLYNALWIYVGAAEDMRAQMLGHLNGNNPCVTHYQPSGFAFELLSPQDHPRRLEELIRQLEPLCEGKTLAYSAGQTADAYLRSGKLKTNS